MSCDNIKLTKIRKEVVDMANLLFQGKLIRQSTSRKKVRNMRKLCLQYVTWGGAVFILKHKRLKLPEW